MGNIIFVRTLQRTDRAFVHSVQPWLTLLTAAGYDYAEIQKLVNEMLK